MKKKEFIEWNEKMFIKYNNVRLYDHPNPLIRYTENKRVSTIINELQNSEEVIDVGCGEGYVLSKMNSPFLVGVDISKTAVQKAFKATNAIIVRADAESLPFSDSFFDTVVCSETIEHTINPEKILREIGRIASPDANIIITIPNEPLINRIKDLIWNLGLFDIIFPNVPKRQNDEWHLHSFDLSLLQKLCGRLLKIKKIHAIPFGFLPIRYVVVCKNLKTKPAKSERLFSYKVKSKNNYLDAL